MSSRGAAPPVSLSEAIAQGLAPDGGLYVPTRLPVGAIRTLAPASQRLPQIARVALARFLRGRPAAAGARGDCRCRARSGRSDDRGRGLPGSLVRARAVSRARPPPSRTSGRAFWRRACSACETPRPQPLTILVATSGDTGGAVAAAFHRRPWVRVVILYPAGLVSPRQEQQLTLLGGQCRVAAHRRHLRRLSAIGEGGLRRSAP